MTLIPNILAASGADEELLQLILIVGAAVVVGVIRWLGKKAVEKQTEQQAAEQARRLQESLEADRARPAPPSTPPVLQDQRQMRQTPYPPIGAPPGTPNRPEMTPQAPPQVPRRRRRKPPTQPQETVVLEPVEHRLVEAEVAMPSAEHRDFYAYGRRPGAPGRDAAQAAWGMALDLSNPDALRQAVIYHELLSPPKALRHDPEPWEV